MGTKLSIIRLALVRLHTYSNCSRVHLACEKSGRAKTQHARPLATAMDSGMHQVCTLLTHSVKVYIVELTDCYL